MRFFKLVQSWLWRFKPTRTVKKFGWLPSNWRVKTMKIRERGMISYYQVFFCILDYGLSVKNNTCESPKGIIKDTKFLFPKLPQGRLRAVSLSLKKVKKKAILRSLSLSQSRSQSHSKSRSQSRSKSHLHSRSHANLFCVLPRLLPVWPQALLVCIVLSFCPDSPCLPHMVCIRRAS